MRTRAQVRRVTASAMVVFIAVVLGGGEPARAEVTSTSGSAFGVQVRLLGVDLVAPTPAVKGGPATGYPMTTKSAAEVGLLAASCPVSAGEQPANAPLLNVATALLAPVLDAVPLLEVCGLTVSSVGETGPTANTKAAKTTASIAGVAVGGGLTLNGVTQSCKADGDSATAGLTVTDGSRANGTPLTGDVAPNSRIANLPGILDLVLNAQVKTTEAGVNGIVADAARITLLDNTVVVLGHVECLATVSQLPPSSSTWTSTSTSSTSSSSTSSTTSSTTTTRVPVTAACEGRTVNVGTFAVGQRFVLPVSSPCSFVPGGPVTVTVNGGDIPGKTADANGFVMVDITILSGTQLSIDDPVLVPALCGVNTVSVTGVSVASGARTNQTATFTAACQSVPTTTSPATTVPNTLSNTGMTGTRASWIALALMAIGVYAVMVTSHWPPESPER